METLEAWISPPRVPNSIMAHQLRRWKLIVGVGSLHENLAETESHHGNADMWYNLNETPMIP